MRKLDRRTALAFSLAVAVMLSAGDAHAQSIGQYVDDALITSKLRAKISSEFGANLIDVETKNGVVRLSGTAESRMAAGRAEQLAWSIEGVKGVRSELQHP